jgi:hypothetical protein
MITASESQNCTLNEDHRTLRLKKVWFSPFLHHEGFGAGIAQVGIVTGYRLDE